SWTRTTRPHSTTPSRTCGWTSWRPRTFWRTPSSGTSSTTTSTPKTCASCPPTPGAPSGPSGVGTPLPTGSPGAIPTFYRPGPHRQEADQEGGQGGEDHNRRDGQKGHPLGRHDRHGRVAGEGQGGDRGP